MENNTNQNTLFIILFVASLAICGLGGFLAVNQSEYVVLAVGILAVITVVGQWSLAGNATGGSGGSNEIGYKQAKLLQLIADRMLISDQAKRITHREQDRDALRQAILQDIKVSDYAAAMALVNDMADVYGYREEAEQFRTQIVEAQAKQRQAIITDATKELEDQLAHQEWEAARGEIDRLTRMFPDQPEIRRLPLKLKEAKERYKHDLIREFKESFEREDHTKAAELLTEMDHYLSPEEARPYMEMAREVLKRKRENLSVQYKMALQDKDWIRAVSVGEQIIREFPNTLMTAEVREMLPTLRERATEQRAGTSG